MDQPQPEFQGSGGMPDLTEYPLEKLWGPAFPESPVLDAAIRKVVAAAEDRPQQAVSAFNSAI